MKARVLSLNTILLCSLLAIAALCLIHPVASYANEQSTTPLTTATDNKAVQKAASSTPVYWIVSKRTGENLYTTSWNEVRTLCIKNKTWINKGIMWYAPDKGKPVYRLVNRKTNDHHFTMDANEVEQLTKVKKTWNADFGGKPIFYSGGDKPIWRLWSESRWAKNQAGTHRFATYNAKMSGWKNEGVKLYCVSYKPSTALAKAQFKFFAHAPSSNVVADPNKFYGAQGTAFDTYTGKDGYAIAISKLASKKNALAVKHFTQSAKGISVVKTVQYSEAQLGHANDATIYKKGAETYLFVAKGGLGNKTAGVIKLSEYNKGIAKVYPVTLSKLDTGSGTDLRGITYAGNKKVNVGGKSVSKDVFIVIAGRRANLMYLKSIGANGAVLERIDSQRFQAPKFGSNECTANGIVYHNGNVFFSWGNERGGNKAGKITYISYNNLFKGTNPNTAINLTELWSKTSNTEFTPESLYFTKLDSKAPLHLVYNTGISGGRDYIDVSKQTY